MASMAASRGLYAVEGLRRGPGDRMGPSNGISSSGRSSGIAGPGTGLQARGSLGLRDDRYLARANMLSGPVPPPLPSHLSGHHGAASHTSAGSRSVPPGSRRPTTPSGTQYQGPRRPSGATDDPTARLASGALPQSNAFDGRDVLPVRSAGDANRSRSVTNSGARFGAGSGVQDRERPREGLSSGGSSGSSTCDKCDGKHPTDRCPHFRGEREKHKDAWCNYGNKNAPHHMGSAGGNFVLKSARVCRQPGDGSCLFHSMLHGLQQHGSSQGSNSAQALRRELASFLQQNSSRQIAGDTLEEWVRWDANSSVNEYARRMAVGGWGGGIEMACCSLLKNVNVHVYETSGRAEFKRISCFDCPNAARTIHVLYQGGVHYDALQPLVS